MSDPMKMTKGESECREELHQRIAALEAENANLWRQVEFVKRQNSAGSSGPGSKVCLLCHCRHTMYQPHHPDCPHRPPEATE